MIVVFEILSEKFDVGARLKIGHLIPLRRAPVVHAHHTASVLGIDAPIYQGVFAATLLDES
jgi:hypothetical protein